MLAVLDRQQRLLKTQLSLTSLVGALLDPLLIVSSLLVSASRVGETLDARCIVLALIVFAMIIRGLWGRRG